MATSFCPEPQLPSHLGSTLKGGVNGQGKNAGPSAGVSEGSSLSERGAPPKCTLSPDPSRAPRPTPRKAASYLNLGGQ